MDMPSLTPVAHNSCGRIFYRHRWAEWVAAPALASHWPDAESRRCTRCRWVEFRSEPA